MIRCLPTQSSSHGKNMLLLCIYRGTARQLQSSHPPVHVSESCNTRLLRRREMRVGFDQMLFRGLPNEITAAAAIEKVPAKLLFRQRSVGDSWNYNWNCFLTDPCGILTHLSMLQPANDWTSHRWSCPGQTALQPQLGHILPAHPAASLLTIAFPLYSNS